MSSNNSKDVSSSSIPILYSCFRSSASWRVRIALAIKGIEYEYKAVNLLQKENFGEEFLKINPLAQVPVFGHNGNLISQSMAILEYIEEMWPNKPLLPSSPVDKSKVRELCEIVGSGIQPMQNNSVMRRMYGEDMDKHCEWGNFWIEKGFAALEKKLEKVSGKYCFGNAVTLADCFLVPQVANATIIFKVNLSKFPNIARITENLAQLDPFKQAHAFAQSDCPDDMRKEQRLK